MSRLHKIVAAFAIVPVLAIASPAFAVIQSSIEGGNIYRVKNVTKNTVFTDPVNADACDVLEYWVRVHNIGPDSPLTNVTVKAAFQSAVSTTNTSTITVRGDNAHPSSTTDTATVNLSSAQSLTYVSGSTQLFDSNDNFMQNLPDGITGAGVNIGTVGVSTAQKRFVHFKMKTNCPEVPQAKFECKALDVTKVDRTRFTFTARAEATNATIQSYTFTVRNSAGATVDTHTVNTSATSAVYNFNQSTAGTYTVSVIVKTDKGSTSVKDNCTKQVTVDAQPVVQGKTTLPDTGPGALLGVFAGASALGTAAHYAFRRFVG